MHVSGFGTMEGQDGWMDGWLALLVIVRWLDDARLALNSTKRGENWVEFLISGRNYGALSSSPLGFCILESFKLEEVTIEVD